MNSLFARCTKIILSRRVTNLPSPPQPFYGSFPGPPGWAGARRELLDFMVPGKISGGRHMDNPAGRHSIRTNQCPPPPSHIFTGRMPFLPPNQQCQNTEGRVRTSEINSLTTEHFDIISTTVCGSNTTLTANNPTDSLKETKTTS